MITSPKMNLGSKLRISLVDLSGEASIRYTPLALMCLRASLEDDPTMSDRIAITIHAFLQSQSIAEMIDKIAAEDPHIIGISCQGWNFRQICLMFDTLKQLLPNSILMLGGNHVSNRGAELLRKYEQVDVVVNGEGENTFREFVAHTLSNSNDFSTIAGLSFRDQGQVITTKEREKTKDLASLPSPYQMRESELKDYDIALLETNRGCPYKCSFCYWGGRIGQKMAKSELSRIKEDIYAIGRAGIESIFLCDANFGILPQDIEVAKMIVEARNEFGAPREFNVNWAKNNSERVGQIIRILREGGIHTAINVPLQTLNSRALALADRNEFGRAEMIAQAKSLIAEGTEVFCELIFGLPGEPLEDFKKNYDRLILDFPVLRIHPLWVLPNTTYAANRAELKIVTISPDVTSDYEAIYSHCDMDSNDMRDGLAFLLAHSNLNLLGIGRNALRAYALLAGGRPSDILIRFEQFVLDDTSPLAKKLAQLFTRIRQACYFERHLRDRERQCLYRSQEETQDLVGRFFQSIDMSPCIAEICLELVKYDVMLLPRSDLKEGGFETTEKGFAFNPVEVSRMLSCGDHDGALAESKIGPVTLTVRHKSGLARLEGSNCDLTGSWNGRVMAVNRTSHNNCVTAHQ